MWSKFWNLIRSVINRMKGSKDITEALNVVPMVSDQMEEAIEQWGKMYMGESEWLHEPTASDPTKIISLGLASSIASEKARMATIEMQSLITDPTIPETGEETLITEDYIPTSRAQYLNKQYQLHLLPHIRKQLEYGIAKGGLVIKPYIYDNDKLQFSYCQADEFYPISFDSTGKMTEAAFTERIVLKGVRYTRLEYHRLDLSSKTVTVMNKAFKTFTKDPHASVSDLGSEVELSEVPSWATIQPVTVINNVDRLLFAYFKMPEANTVDPTSPLGVSGYSRAVGLIREADLQASRMIWEYEGGQLAVDVDRDALKTVEVPYTGLDPQGKRVKKTKLIEAPNTLQARLFRKIDVGTDETYNVFAPALRDSNYIMGLNQILQRIEDTCGISRGTFSDITRSEAKTATEMLILRQRSYATNNDIQKALQSTLEDAVYIMNVYCTLYGLAPEGNYTVSFEWDDSLINSPEEELQRRLTLMNAGIESKVSVRMWYFGETEEQARQALAIVDEEAMRNAEMQALATGLVQQANPNNQQNNNQKNGGKETPPDKNTSNKKDKKEQKLP